MNKYINKKKALLLLLVLGVYVVIITPLLIINLRNQQDTRSRAAQDNQAADICGNVPADIMLIIDRSGSMGEVNKLNEAKTAARNFIDVISRDGDNRIGLVSFSNRARLNVGLTNNFSYLKNEISSLRDDGYTCHECALKEANDEIQSHGRQGVKKVIVLLTDGKANYILNRSGEVNEDLAELKAKTEALRGYNTSRTAIYTIGFGLEDGRGNKGYNGDWLQEIALLSGGKYYYPAPGELESVYQEISQLIGKGLVGGFIFNDVNGNGAFDDNEPKLSGWTLELTSGSLTKTITTDDTGTFTLKELCDGSYQLKQNLQSGWVQTLPTDPNGYSIIIDNGNSFTDNRFGNMVAPPSRCSDGIDNDNNGFTDSQDSTCHTDGNPDNPNSYDPDKDGEHGGNTCADSIDNNNNQLKDGADPICHTDGNASNPESYDPNLPESNPTPTPTPTLSPTPRPSSTPAPSSTPNPTSTPRPTSTPFPTATPTPTPNPTPANTFLSLTIFHHGVGDSGDNTNPDQYDLSNKNPVNTTIDADVELFNSDNQLFGQGRGPLTYDPSTGNFKGDLGIYPNTFPSGKYYMKVKTNIHLKKLVSGILDIKAGQNNVIPATTLVTGDANNDNKLSILDYNSLLDCYSDLAAAVACDATKKTHTDFNDDAFVNQVDYNLFLREIATQPGQ